MAETLEDFLLRLRGDRTIFMSGEEATCQGAILPILSRLGWDRDNVREVIPQFQVENGRVDYCLKIGNKKAAFIEVKRANEALDHHQRQLLEYAFGDGVEIAVLTNGIVWWLYLPLLRGSWEQRKFLAIDIQQQGVQTAAQNLRTFLEREAIANDSAVEKARDLHESRVKDRLIRQTMPSAWHQLCEEPDDLIIELLADKVESLCGHKPDHAHLAEYLSTAIGEVQTSHTTEPSQTTYPP